MSERRNWTREELLVALKIYCELEFGQFHSRNPRIIEVAERIHRTSGSLAMKLCNFSSLDPAMQGKGLKGASKADSVIIGEFLESPEKMILESEHAYENLILNEGYKGLSEPPAEPFIFDFENVGETERVAQVKIRTVQHFFRLTVISSYCNKCAICSLTTDTLLIASHIIPWSRKVESRADPTNGISLCALHDKAFDNGFISVNRSYKMIISPHIAQRKERVFEDMFYRFDGKEIHLPFRFTPNSDYLEWHQENIYHQ